MPSSRVPFHRVPATRMAPSACCASPYAAPTGPPKSESHLPPFANVASSWALWQLKGDKKAGAMFAGKDCGLCKNPSWDTASKGFGK